MSWRLGQRVQLTLPSNNVLAYVTDVQGGGIVSGLRGGGRGVTPARLVVQARFEIPVDPTSPIVTSVIRVHEDKQRPEEELAPRGGLIELAN